METRAHHVLIGAFTLAIAFAGLAFALWVGKVQFDRLYAHYDILITDEAITGLTVSSDVRYQGVRIGEVARIGIDQETGGVRVTVRVEIRDDIVIYDTTKASLELLGITGGVFMQISNAGVNGTPLPRVFDINAPLPEITYEPSVLQSLFMNVPSLLSSADSLLRDLRALARNLTVLTGPENQDSIKAILSNVRTLSDALGGEADNMGRIVNNTAEITDSARGLVAGLEGLLQTLEAKTGPTLDGLNDAVRSVDAAASAAAGLVQDNEAAINAFTSQGLAQFAVLVVETRQLVVRLESALGRFETDPSGFIFGGAKPVEVEIEE